MGAEKINLASPAGVRSERASRARQMIWLLFMKQSLSRRKNQHCVLAVVEWMDISRGRLEAE